MLNLGNAPLPAILLLQEDTEHTYYLTGSRFFGTEYYFSDWDFYTQNSDEVQEFLYLHDFSDITDSYNDDPLITKVMGREHIHIQLVNDVELKTRAQIYIKENDLISNSKSANERIWSRVIREMTQAN